MVYFVYGMFCQVNIVYPVRKRETIKLYLIKRRRIHEEKGVTTLSGLDLAALLRILDKNWYDVSSRGKLDNEARTWTREMQHTRHHALWAAARLEHTSYNNELVRFLRQSLTASHTARKSILQGQLQSATNEKICLMRKSQCESAEADFVRRMADLDKAELQADLTARPVAFGVMVVE